MITSELIETILAQYSLPYFGIHGLSHWARVLENGRRLAKETGANPAVVELFAVFHDSRRVNEGTDFEHGLRGAQFAESLRGALFELSDDDFELLYLACAHHTDGRTDGDITIQTCWDSDRLDLGRVGVTPDRKYLCTAPAKTPEILEWADERGSGYVVPDLIRGEWLVVGDD